MLLSCSLRLPLARSCSLRLPIALRICVQHPRSAHKAIAQLAAALQHFMLLWCGVSRSSQRNALLIHRYYSQFGTTQLKEMVKNRLKRARLGPKCPFWWPRRSLEGTEDQIWSLLSLAAPPVLDSWLSHTLD